MLLCYLNAHFCNKISGTKPYHLHAFLQLLRQGKRGDNGLSQRPRPRLKHINAEIDPQLNLLTFGELLELVIQIGRNGHIGEHPMQLAGEFISASLNNQSKNCP